MSIFLEVALYVADIRDMSRTDGVCHELALRQSTYGGYAYHARSNFRKMFCPDSPPDAPIVLADGREIGTEPPPYWLAFEYNDKKRRWEEIRGNNLRNTRLTALCLAHAMNVAGDL